MYILYSEKINRYYIGHTKNLQSRLERHNGGGVKSTKNKGPWRVVYFEEYPNKIEANRRELALKKMKSRKYLEELIRSH